MDGSGADDAGELPAALSVDDDSLAEDDLVEEAADRDHPQEPFVVDVRDGEADLVHVGGHHDLGAVALTDADDVPHLVGADLVDKRFHLFANQLGHAVLEPGHAVRIGELLEQGAYFAHLNAPSETRIASSSMSRISPDWVAG